MIDLAHRQQHLALLQRFQRGGDHGRFADPRRSPNRHQFRRTALADPLKRGDDVAGLRMRREKRIGQMDRRRAILLAGNKVDNFAFNGQRRLAAPEVGNQPVDGLIAILRILLQQLKDNGRQHAGYVRAHPTRRKRFRGNVIMRPVGLVISAQFKRQSPGQKFIKHDPQTVEIAPAVNGAPGTRGVFR